LSRRRDTDVAKGTLPMEIRPDMWSGNYFTDQHEQIRRFHGVQTVAWDRDRGGIKHRIKMGGEFDWIDSTVQLDRRNYSQLDADGDLRALSTFAGPNSADTHNQEYGAFVQDRIGLNPKMQLEIGVRYDRERIAGRNNFSPRAAFSFLPFGTTRSKLSGGAGLFYDNITLLSLQLPQLQRRFTTIYAKGVPATAPAATAVQVNQGLRNPFSFHWNLSWENEWAPRWVSRIDYIQKTGRDQVRLAAELNPAGFNMVFNNSGKSDYRAIEFSLDRPIRTNLRFLASYIYSNAKARPSLDLDFPDPAVELLPEAPVAWDSPHRFVAWGYFPLPAGLSASFSMEARSGFPFTTIDDLNRVVGEYNGQNIPAYFVTNASLEKQIPLPFGSGKRMALRVGVTNLFNRFNPRFIDTNVNSPYFLSLSDSSSRHFSARVRFLKK
jgi:outer membrane receptor protein involved in Fe transport